MKKDLIIDALLQHDKCPKAGRGVHQWLVNSALKLKKVDPQVLVPYLIERSDNCGRFVDEREVFSAVDWARDVKAASPDRKSNSRPHQQSRPTPVDADLVKEISKRKPLFLNALPSASPLDEYPVDKAHRVIQLLFARRQPDPLIAFGRDFCSFEAAPLSEVLERQELSLAQFMVPNPLLGMEGPTANGKRMSPRATSNIGNRINQVVEFDDAPIEDQKRFIEYLAESAPLILVLFSEGKSLHSWFDVENLTEAELSAFQRKAEKLGADPKMWSVSQLARVPWGIRHSKDSIQAPCRHRVLFSPALKGSSF